MIETVDGIASVVEELAQKVRELEHRVATLEGRAVGASAAVVAEQTTTERVVEASKGEHAAFASVWEGKTPPPTWKGFPTPETPAGVFTTMGKAVLGMAGAYLLRAIADMGAVPKLAVAVVAIVYAAAWMVWAVRAYDRSRFASITFAVTSALILAPMLWELTVRFQTLSPTVTSAVLAGYMILTLALAAGRNLETPPWVATVAVSVTAVALIVATHALVPLAMAMLLVALASELSGCVGHRLTQRVLAALAADFVVWQIIDVMTLSKTVPEGYQATSSATIASLCLALPAIYAGSIGVRCFLRRETVTYFDVGQSVVAFGLGTFGAMRATQGGIGAALGLVFLACAVVCYWGALARFLDGSVARNRRVSASWAAALLIVGSWLLLPSDLQVPFWSVAAVVAAWLYARTAKFSFGIHASVYLLAAAVFSPVLAYLMNALAGSEMSRLPWSAWIVGLAAAASYIVGARHPEQTLRRRILWVVPAMLAGFAVAALMVSAIVGVAGGLAASRLSMVRTIVGCAVALGLAFIGSRWKRAELGWVAYAAVGFGTLKLLVEDLRYGNAASLVVSLLFYGGVLILLPKMMQRGKAEAQES